MAWRIVKQPGGLYARFSEVVDDFTHIEMTREEAFELCRVHMGIEDAARKIQAADDNPGRYQEALDIIATIHGATNHPRSSSDPAPV